MQKIGKIEWRSFSSERILIICPKIELRDSMFYELEDTYLDWFLKNKISGQKFQQNAKYGFLLFCCFFCVRFSLGPFLFLLIFLVFLLDLFAILSFFLCFFFPSEARPKAEPVDLFAKSSGIRTTKVKKKKDDHDHKKWHFFLRLEICDKNDPTFFPIFLH